MESKPLIKSLFLKRHLFEMKVAATRIEESTETQFWMLNSAAFSER